ncbi:peptidyl-prolyl cis-trans isomerase [bacterium]|nr:peptidyl-prolyl cis-trans isomerase [bacterium]
MKFKIFMVLKFVIPIILLELFMVILISNCEKGDNGEYVAKVDELKLSVDDLYENTPQEYLDNISKEQKKRYIEDWIQEALFYKEALKMGLDKNPAVQKKLEEARWQIIVESFLEEEIRSKIEITDDEIQNYYNAHQEEYFRTEDEWRASHILVSTEEKAESIMNELTEDKQFEALATEKSEDPSAEAGGDLGYFTKDEILPELADVLSDMGIGQISPIIPTEFGYHILKLTDFQPHGTVKNIEEVKDEIQNILFMEKYMHMNKSLVDSLRTIHHVETNPDIWDSL